jgi:Na+-transporting methylmalonyl-CoA/oxaloacetate decarboxylase gamma subunit
MHQQINLYQPVFRKQEKVFSAITLLQIGAAVLLLLLIILAHAHWTLSDMNSTAQTLE